MQCNCGDTLIESQTMWYDLNNCPDYGIIIGADNLNLNCYYHSITGNNQGNFDAGIYLNNISSSTIATCNITNFYDGIHLNSSSANTLQYNFIISNQEKGIWLEDNSNNNFLNTNKIYNNNEGIHLDSSNNNNLESNNQLSSNIGIWLNNSQNNTLTSNITYYNSIAGIQFTTSTANILISNMINNNYGIALNLINSPSNQFTYNEIRYNNQGMILNLNSNNNTIMENYSNDNYFSGLKISASSNNDIIDNDFERNYFGAYLEDYSTNNTFTANHFVDNSFNNAYEDINVNNNHWNLDLKGNFWSDLTKNPAYPYYYEIYGPGDGIDWHPFNLPSYACGETVLENAVLSGNLYNCPEDGLIIGADNITIDCNGFMIDGIASSTSSGIYSDNKNNVTITNCTIQEFNQGVYSANNSAITITDDEIKNNNYGIYFTESSENQINDNKINNNQTGIYLANSSTLNNLYNNIFLTNNINAYEAIAVNGNNWDYNNRGNTWSDFFSNPGYPNYYEIAGPGDGIDHYPSPYQYIIDDSNPQFIVQSGHWNSTSTPNAINGETHYNNPGLGREAAFWRVDNYVISGRYGVYVWKFDNPYLNTIATNTHYMVFHRNGASDWLIVNQATPINEWVYLGDYEFDNSQEQGVRITDEANNRVIADAVKFVYYGPLSRNRK